MKRKTSPLSPPPTKERHKQAPQSLGRVKTEDKSRAWPRCLAQAASEGRLCRACLQGGGAARQMCRGRTATSNA